MQNLSQSLLRNKMSMQAQVKTIEPYPKFSNLDRRSGFYAAEFCYHRF